MANKTMPERIWAWEQDGFRDFDNMAGWKENGIVSDFEGAEYVRSDLAAGDASEPLAGGQYRWIKISDEWTVAKIKKYCEKADEAVLVIIGCDFDMFLGNWDESIEWGPVIHPPADTTN